MGRGSIAADGDGARAPGVRPPQRARALSARGCRRDRGLLSPQESPISKCWSVPRTRPRAWKEGVQHRCVKTELDSLATALYVKTDDLLKASPHLAPWRPVIT